MQARPCSSEEWVEHLSGQMTYYQYDHNGQRARKTIVDSSSALKHEWYYFGDFEVYRKTDTGTSTLLLERQTLRVMDGETCVAIIDSPVAGTLSSSESQTLRYQLSNHIGSASMELDEDAQIISYEEYYPFGNTSYQAGRSLAEVSLKRYRYVGKERDNETGFYYIGARCYCPWLARWLAVDPINSEWYNLCNGNPHRNRQRNYLELTAGSYEYCYANPVRFTDPTGEQVPPGQNTPRSWTDESGNRYSMGADGVASAEGGTVTGSKSSVTGSEGASSIGYQNLQLVPNNALLPPGKTKTSRSSLESLAVLTMGFIEADVITPDPTDVAAEAKAVVYPVLYGLAAAAVYLGGREEIQTKPVALPVPLTEDKTEENGRLIYRSMKGDDMGFPLVEESARGLGVRINQDIPLAYDQVLPLTGGMSTAPDNPLNLPSHRRPPSLGGTGKDPVFEFNTKNLPLGLKWVQDAPGHGTIQPSFVMPYETYKTLLSSTKYLWKKI